MEAPLIAAVHTHKLLIPVVVPHIATAVTPKQRTTAAVNRTAAAVNTTNRYRNGISGCIKRWQNPADSAIC
jgi:hypothetical protein